MIARPHENTKTGGRETNNVVSLALRWPQVMMFVKCQAPPSPWTHVNHVALYLVYAILRDSLHPHFGQHSKKAFYIPASISLRVPKNYASHAQYSGMEIGKGRHALRYVGVVVPLFQYSTIPLYSIPPFHSTIPFHRIKTPDSWGGTSRVIVTEVVDFSLLAFARLTRETASKLTSYLGCWLVSPRVQTGCSKCACAGVTLLRVLFT